MKKILTLILAALLLVSPFALPVQAETPEAPEAGAEEAAFTLAEDGFTTELCFTRPYLLLSSDQPSGRQTRSQQGL